MMTVLSMGQKSAQKTAARLRAAQPSAGGAGQAGKKAFSITSFPAIMLRTARVAALVFAVSTAGLGACEKQTVAPALSCFGGPGLPNADVALLGCWAAGSLPRAPVA
jgi:hypothetical protein